MGLLLEDCVVKIYFLLLWSNKWGDSIYPIFMRLPLDNKISIESPLGKAIRGHREGDRVMVKVNDTVSYPVVIKAIVKTTEDEDDQIRSF